MEFSDRYPLTPFQSVDNEKIFQIIQRYPLATMIIQNDPYPLVSQVPLICNLRGGRPVELIGHIDMNNPMVPLIKQGATAYCPFSGPNSYISPSIYLDQQYPGWNYFSVHVAGKIFAMESSGELSDLLLQLASVHEPPDSGYSLTPEQPNYHSLLDYILGFRIAISESKAIIKLAQDKSPKNTERARKKLGSFKEDDLPGFLSALLK